SGAVSHDILSSASPVFSVRFASVLSYSFLPRSGTASGMTFFRRRPRSFPFVLLPRFLIFPLSLRHFLRHDLFSSASPAFSVLFFFLLSISFLPRVPVLRSSLHFFFGVPRSFPFVLLPYFLNLFCALRRSARHRTNGSAGRTECRREVPAGSNGRPVAVFCSNG